MSLESICSGDRVRKVTIGGGSFGETPTATEGDPIECRIDISSTSESFEEGVSIALKSGSIYFAKDPKLQTGHYLRWLSRGCKAITDSILFRVVGIDNAEGRPGDPPWLWTAEVIEDRKASGYIREETA